MTEVRKPINIRLKPEALARIEARAQADHRNRSEMIRLMLAYADQKMPAGWKP